MPPLQFPYHGFLTVLDYTCSNKAKFLVNMTCTDIGGRNAQRKLFPFISVHSNSIAAVP